MNASAIAAPPATHNPVIQAPDLAPKLIVASQDVLLQGLTLLFKMSDRAYSQFVGAYGASIGEHYRHVVQDFECVIRSIRSGEINYGTRKDNPRLETETNFATLATYDLLRTMKNYDQATLNRTCKVGSALPEVGSQPLFVETNVGRELAYCIGNAIHHYAIIRLICNQIGFEVPREFGTARAL